MIVFVHGLWLTGVESAWLRRRVSAELGCEACAFHYRSVKTSVREAVDALHAFITGLKSHTIHLVGHSLGSILVLRLLERYSDVPPGRVVLLGPPVAGSCVAERLARWRIGPAILGQIVEEEILKAPRRQWDGARELGIIAGDQSLGLGRIVACVPYPHDGTIAVVETQLPGVTDHIVLHVSHTGMLFSAATARQTAYFLKHGRFARPAGL